MKKETLDRANEIQRSIFKLQDELQFLKETIKRLIEDNGFDIQYESSFFWKKKIPYNLIEQYLNNECANIQIEIDSLQSEFDKL